MIELLAMWAAVGLTATTVQNLTPGVLEGRACTYEDVTGLWRSRLRHAEEPGVELFAAVAPNDYLRFKADGDFMYYASPRPEPVAAGVHASLDRLDGLDNVTYRAEVRTGGVLVIHRDGQPFQGFTCSVGEPMDGKPVLIWTELQGFPSVRRVSVRMD